MKIVFTCLLCFPLMLAVSAAGDTILLSEVVKVETVSHDANNITPFTDLKYKQGERLSDALGEFSSVYVKSYGSGGLATLAIRGTSAEQTEIQWNGIRLNAPTLGQLDLALFLIGMQDKLQLVHTGYEGSIGGILKMDNEVKLDSGFSLGATFRVGSFNTYEAMVDGQYAQDKFSGSTKFGFLSSENNFFYQNPYEPGNPYVQQTNATVRQLSFLQQFNVKINPVHELNFYVWLIDASRQIPPLMSQPLDKQSQDDYSLRTMADWKAKFRKLQMKFTSAWLDDKMRYKDPNALLDETYTTYALRNKLHFFYSFPFGLGIQHELNYDHEQANTPEFGGIKTREILGFKTYADYFLLNRLRLHGGFREDLVDKKLSAFAPELALNYTQHKFDNIISTGIIASRNFRFPTLNDLYWVPGGNPDLKEEKSWNGELQFKYGYKKIVEVTASNFYIYTTDWIQWVPQGDIWMAENFRRVFSRGAEAALHLSNGRPDNSREFIVQFNTSYTYTKATNLDATSAGDQSQGKQLIYVPYHNVIAGLQLGYRRFYLRSVNHYTGSVFISTDNSQSLAGYFTSDLEAGKDISLKNAEVGFSFRVNNIGNLQYQVVAQRPMPGRNFEGTLRLKFFN
jgi:vitamin B12 transporter